MYKSTLTLNKYQLRRLSEHGFITFKIVKDINCHILLTHVFN